jgi:hypothetical protein
MTNNTDTITIDLSTEMDLAINTIYSGDFAINGTLSISDDIWSSHNFNQSHKEIIIGETVENHHKKIYIVEPWQSKNPIEIESGLWISLEEDLISNEELKQKVFDKLSETNPDFIVKCGMNKDNISLRKSEVSLEINKEK